MNSEFKHRITIDSVLLGIIELTEKHCLTLIGTYAFSGNNYIVCIKFFQERQRKNIGRLLRNFHNFELASKCEVRAKKDVEISLSS